MRGAARCLVQIERGHVVAVSGASMLGELECSGIGSPVQVDAVASVEGLQNSISQHNEKLLGGLRESEHSGELLRSAACVFGWVAS